MSWNQNQWNTGMANIAPNTQVLGASIPLNPNANSQIPYNPAIMPPGSSYTSQFSGMTPEQQYAMQQNWQQWQSYQQQYAQWHAQYGEQYKREMEGKMGAAPPSVPFSPSIPNPANIAQYSQIIPPTTSVVYAAPPPPPDNDLKKPINVTTDQPPPPPPPPENTNYEEKKITSSQTSNIQEIGKNYSRNIYTDNRPVFGSNDREISQLDLDNKRMTNYEYQQNYEDRKIHKNLDTAQNASQSIECNSIQNNNSSEDLSTSESKSREEKIFDEQFRKWEEEFENWKKANVNHPDKKAYREYEMKFEDCRRKLIERREQMRRKKIQQEQQARHDLLIKEQKIREEQIKQEQQRQKDEESKKEQQIKQIIEEQTREPPQILTNKVINEPRVTDKIENKPLFEEARVEKHDSDVEINTDFLDSGKKEFGIPGLDLVQTESPKEGFEDSNIIDLEKTDECDVSRQKLWVKNVNQKTKTEKSRWSNSNERNKEILHKGRNSGQYERGPENYTKKNEFSGNDIRPISNKIPSLFDLKFEKPTFSPPHETSKILEFVKSENEFIPNIEDNLKNPPVPLEDESNNMQNLANALANPNVLALLNAALQKHDQIAIENTDEIIQERNYNEMDDKNNNYNSERNNQFMRNDFFSGGRNESYNGNQGNTRFDGGNKNRFDGGNIFGGNRAGINVWEQDNRNNNWRNQNNSDVSMDSGIMNKNEQPIWNNEQNLKQDPQSYRNPFNALNRGSEGKYNNFDDSGSRNSFDNDRGREREQEWKNDRNNRNNRNRNRRRSKQNNRNSSDASSISSKDNNFNQNTKTANNINPFKNDLNMMSKSPNFKQQLEQDDEYFRPAHVIDYQNKPLLGVVNTTPKETDTIATKIVDYGHKTSAIKNISANIDTEVFFPMKTIDYGHASNKTDLEPKKPTLSFGDFLANRTNNPKRKADGDDVDSGDFGKKSKIPIFERSNNTEYAEKWTIENKEIQQTLKSLTKCEKKEKTMVNIIDDCKIDENYLSYSKENLEAVSDVENDFDEPNLISNKDDIDSLKSIKTLINITPLKQTSNIINKIQTEESIHSTNVQYNNIQISIPTFQNNNTIIIDEVILNPGRLYRPKNIVIILRGPPGSGKSYIAKLIKDKEIELNGSAPRVLSIDDYFMVETDKDEKCPNTGRKITRKVLVYEYDKIMESKYFEYLMKSYKKTLQDQHFNFIIVDCVNDSLRTFTEFYNLAKLSNYTPYTIDLHCNLEKCLKQNVHNRNEEDIKNILKNWNNTPDHYIKLDVNNIVTRFKSSKDVDETIVAKDNEVCNLQSENSDSQNSFGTCAKTDFMKCKWDVDASKANLARLDGTRKIFQNKTTLEDYLQIDGWEPPPSNSNKKRVRWADIEEKRAQDKMRAIGFVVGQTDWNRMLDPTGGSSALTKTKFIEKLCRRK